MYDVRLVSCTKSSGSRCVKGVQGLKCRCEHVDDHCDGETHAQQTVHTQLIQHQCFLSEFLFFFVYVFFWYRSLKQIVYFWRNISSLYVYYC